MGTEILIGRVFIKCLLSILIPECVEHGEKFFILLRRRLIYLIHRIVKRASGGGQKKCWSRKGYWLKHAVLQLSYYCLEITGDDQMLLYACSFCCNCIGLGLGNCQNFQKKMEFPKPNLRRYLTFPTWSQRTGKFFSSSVFHCSLFLM